MHSQISEALLSPQDRVIEQQPPSSKCGNFLGWLFSCCKSRKENQDLNQVFKNNIQPPTVKVIDDERKEPEKSRRPFSTVIIQGSEEDPDINICCSEKQCGKRVFSVWKGLHHPLPKGVAITAAAITVIVGAHFNQSDCVFWGTFSLGFFVQSLASYVKRHKIRSTIKTAAVVERIFTHLSLPFIVITLGYYRDETWASLMNTAFGGVFLNNFFSHLFDKPFCMPNPNLAPEPFLKRHRVKLIIFVLSSATFTYGTIRIFTNSQKRNENEKERVLTGDTRFVEYGIKGLSSVVGVLIEEYLLKKSTEEEGNVGWVVGYNVTHAIYPIGMVISVWTHGEFATNVAAMTMNIPIGCLLGLELQRQYSLYEVRKQLEEKINYPKKEIAIALHIIGTLGFAAAATYFQLNITKDNEGLPALFIATPVAYYIARFAFPSPSQNREIGKIREYGHILSQNFPQLFAEEIIYNVSFIHAKLIEKSVKNAYIFQSFEGILVGIVQAALFSIYQNINELSEDGSNKALKKILNNLKGSQTRMDIWLIRILPLIKRSLSSS